MTTEAASQAPPPYCGHRQGGARGDEFSVEILPLGLVLVVLNGPREREGGRERKREREREREGGREREGERGREVQNHHQKSLQVLYNFVPQTIIIFIDVKELLKYALEIYIFNMYRTCQTFFPYRSA